MDWIIWHDWASLALRWLHVVCAMAWIGSSFYFIALDLGLQKAPGLPARAHGEEWQVHGGGFYHVTKYLVAPERLPEHLTWFKWESYVTWLSGAALLAVIYWAQAELYLIDPAKLALDAWQGIALSAGSLLLGWLCYDRLCRSSLSAHPTGLMLVLFAILTAMAWGYDQLFTGRAALLHLGAFTATIMTANVFLVIMPNQHIVVADLKAGRAPAPKYGKIAKLRSTHNNYLTLPVVFLMLSGHYPLVFASDYNWLIAAMVFLMGVMIRHFFNTAHASDPWPWWCWAVTLALFLACVALSVKGTRQDGEVAVTAMDPVGQRFAENRHFAEVREIVASRSSMCHARDPLWEGIAHAPRNVTLETDSEIARAAQAVYLQAGLTDAMPPANVTAVDGAERAKIRAWFQEGRRAIVAQTSPQTGG